MALAESDVGSVIAGGQSRAQRYRLLGLQILLIPILYVVQGLTERLDPPRAWVALTGLTVTSVEALPTEPSGITEFSFYRCAQRVGIAIGLFELAFFFVAWAARPVVHVPVSRSLDIAYGDKGCLYLAATNTVQLMTPWTIFYQQWAIVDKKLLPERDAATRCEMQSAPSSLPYPPSPRGGVQ